MADLMKDVAGTGLTFKRVATVGVVGGLTIGVSDYWVEKWWEDDTDAKSRERKRAAAQAALGIGAAYVLKRWSKDAAIGAAAGGIVGGVIRIWESEDMASKMREWFDSEDSGSSGSSGTSGTSGERAGGAVYGERVTFSSPRERATMRG